MRQMTVLALALLFVAPLLALAAPATPPASPALCAATLPPAAPQPPSEQALELSIGTAVVTCSSYCGHPQCLGQPAGEYCLLSPGTVGTCTPSLIYCSKDGIKSCSCIREPA